MFYIRYRMSQIRTDQRYRTGWDLLDIGTRRSAADPCQNARIAQKTHFASPTSCPDSGRMYRCFVSNDIPAIWDRAVWNSPQRASSSPWPAQRVDSSPLSLVWKWGWRVKNYKPCHVIHTPSGAYCINLILYHTFRNWSDKKVFFRTFLGGTA